jgi:hypothetical protein
MSLQDENWTIEKTNPKIPEKWRGVKIKLLTRRELELLKSGTRLVSISGKEAEWNPKNPVDMDTKFGFTAWAKV